MKHEDKIALVPLWEKVTLTLDEATAFSGLGRDKLIDLADNPDCDFVLWIGRKRLYKRKKLEEFLEKAYSL